jgi:hypothetical protein
MMIYIYIYIYIISMISSPFGSKPQQHSCLTDETVKLPSIGSVNASNSATEMSPSSSSSMAITASALKICASGSGRLFFSNQSAKPSERTRWERGVPVCQRDGGGLLAPRTRRGALWQRGAARPFLAHRS